MMRTEREYREIIKSKKDEPFLKEEVILTAYGDSLTFKDKLDRNVTGMTALRVHLVLNHHWSTHDALSVPMDFLFAYCSTLMKDFEIPPYLKAMLD